MRGPTLLLLLCLATPLNGQSPDRGWALQFALSRDGFTGASRDTSTIPGTDVEVTPAPSLAISTGLVRMSGRWEFGVELGYGVGGLRATTDPLRIEDRTADVARYRAAMVLGWQVARPGPVRVLVTASPGLDYWDLGGYGGRTTFAVRGGVLLRIPMGPVELENRLTYGIGGSPFGEEDVPPEGRLETVRTLSVGAGVRLRL